MTGPARRLAWVDAGTGASGDMLLGALVAAGAPVGVLQQAVDALGTEPIRLRAGEVRRAGFVATKVDVECAEAARERTWRDIRSLLGSADALAAPVRERALAVFGRIATVEAAVHGVEPDGVHFHELGALDSIADVVGTLAGLHALGVERLTCSPVGVGSGEVTIAHGRVPVPVPAVARLLADAGAPVHAGPLPFEACTPTAAALLTTVAAAFGPLPAMRVTAVGVGAGGRDADSAPNVLRLFLGEPVAAPGDDGAGAGPVLLETNVDDLDPRLWPLVLDRLFAAGASDAWLTPILMKKGRPAHTLSALTPAEHADGVRRAIFAETTTLGLRELPVSKHALERSTVTVDVDGEPVRVKRGHLDGRVVNAQPEWEDVAAAAGRLGRPAKQVLAAAARAAHDPPSARGRDGGGSPGGASAGGGRR